MANSVSTYTGNAGLGVGSSQSGGGIGGEGLNVINKTAENIMLLNAQRNAKIFEQKVKDRDTQLELLVQGQIQTGEILDKDRTVINSLQKDADKAWDEMVKKGGINNQEAYLDYQKKVKSLKDATVHAQSRILGRKQLELEKSQQKLPKQQKAYEEHIKKADEAVFWDNYNPFQQALTTDFGWQERLGQDAMAGSSFAPQAKVTERVTNTQTAGGKPKTTISTTTSPATGKAKSASPITTTGNVVTKKDEYGRNVTTSEQKYDFGRVLNNVDKAYLEGGEDTEQINTWRKYIEANPNGYEAADVLKHINERIADYVKDTGDTSVEPLKIGDLKTGGDVVQLPNGQFKINMPTAKFGALTVLANHKGSYVTKQSTADTEGAELGLKQKTQAETERHNRATELLKKDANWLQWNKWNFQKDQLKEHEKVGQQKYIDLINHTDNDTNKIDVSQLPASRQFIGGIVYDAAGKKSVGRVYPKYNIYNQAGGKVGDKEGGGFFNKTKLDITYDAYGKALKDKTTRLAYPEWAEEMAKSKGYKVEPYYETRYFNKTGGKVKELSDLPDNFRKIYSEINKKSATPISINQFMKMLSSKGELMAEFEGSNGLGNAASIAESSKYEASQYGKKGFENLYSEDKEDDN